ncbi:MULTISPECIES: proline racemase family protein [unclassified Rhizobium]|uniref:proline racemase family protein n=1 Tax=unclassified Rhizobium TaxID=2613769 RepID=UPI001C836107|nr:MULTISPECIES: proline racemase family protein [unclassified Rhizobium]MBX5160696.1 proline racemase [Rhizobium sp. NZLR8]MBX5167617.1 proline racemase [Rhizobium sp. NZLR4b]MBX5173149.1 proline racemase [Rhizobium sp. NZLR1b]MBX5186183.1 proline racemase [Rhizobium sp. NZLR5]MBX5191849.1 proline racemase [Rhizobium sp. NZLR3b]
MNWDRSLDLLQVHCQGEIGKVIVSGAPEIPGATMLDKMNHINTVNDSLRRFVTFEPRANVAMSVNLLVAPTRADADAGFIVLQADRAHPMSGSNCICVVTALLESGRLPMSEPETIVRLDTPAGLIVARAICRDNRCLSVSLDNVPSFAEALDREVETPKWGRIKIDVAFGGVYYALVDVDQLGLDIAPVNARLLAEAGIELKALLAGQVSVAHPVLSGVDEIAYVMFRGREADGAVRTCTTLQPGRVDRSPCGTGSSANLATLYARGEVSVGDARTSRSIIGGEFLAEAIGETEVGGRRAVLPRITGQAYIYGREQLRISDDDPFAAGFALSDTWGPRVDLLG